jgi:hypothetical protein
LDEYDHGYASTCPYHVTFEVEYSQQLSHGHLLVRHFFRWLYIGLTYFIILYLPAIAVLLAMFMAFWRVLFTERYPLRFFDSVVGFYRWQARVNAYVGFLRDEFPHFRLSL